MKFPLNTAHSAPAPAGTTAQPAAQVLISGSNYSKKHKKMYATEASAPKKFEALNHESDSLSVESSQVKFLLLLPTQI